MQDKTEYIWLWGTEPLLTSKSMTLTEHIDL